MEPQHLAVGRGWEWVKQGYALFVKAPLLWIVFLIIWFASAIMLSAIPVVGDPFVSLLTPVIFVGLMAGCRALSQGEELELAHLFSGFHRHTGHLVTIGGFSLIGLFIIYGLMMLTGGAEVITLITSSQPPENPELILKAFDGAGYAIALGLALYLFLLTIIQFASMLVFFNDVPPVQAVQLSFHGILRNIGAMLVYEVTLMFIAILASIPVFLGWLVLLPLMFTSMYASYIDIFPVAKESAPAAEDPFKPGDTTP